VRRYAFVDQHPRLLHRGNRHAKFVGEFRVRPTAQGGEQVTLLAGPKPEACRVLGTYYSEAFKSNDRGDVVGLYITDDRIAHGFLLRNGGVTTLDFPWAMFSRTTGFSGRTTLFRRSTFPDPAIRRFGD
jgi:hypothetical protein